MAVTRIKRLSGDVENDGNITSEGSIEGKYIRTEAYFIAVGATGRLYVNNGSSVAVRLNSTGLDFSTDTLYPDLVAVGACTKANETYAKVKVGGTIKRILVYDDA